MFRIAEVKYKLSFKVSTFYEAFEKLCHECVFKNFIPEPWQAFRENELWKLEPVDTLEANQMNLLKIYNWIIHLKGPTGDGAKEKAIQLAIDPDYQLQIDRLRAYHCFGMSKMTVKYENINSAHTFNVLEQVEFYEYIGRLAAEKYKGRLEMTLVEKINRTMDLIFPKF